MACGAEQADATNGTVGGAARPAGSEPVAARRLTTILFGDLVGFRRSFPESRDAEDTRSSCPQYFAVATTVVAPVRRHDPEFIGDAVMAVWGVPIAHEDDAERAVRAGLDLIAEVGTSLADLNMRVGIVTGEVAGDVGGAVGEGDGRRRRGQHRGARRQAAAEPGQIWVDTTPRDPSRAQR